MKKTISLFSTEIYNAPIGTSKTRIQKLNRELIQDAYRIRDQDDFGMKWSKTNYPNGYTSYSSFSELHQMSSTFLELKKFLDAHVKAYARSLDMNIKEHPLEITQMWVNIMGPGAYHTAHIHPLSSISGTYYVQCPSGSGEIKFEDPRLALFMGSIPRVAKARPKNERFISIHPDAGQVVLFESWLKHEVVAKKNAGERVSVSFNYNWF
jgi:uncharacterized protein (TIGR02466 family)